MDLTFAELPDGSLFHFVGHPDRAYQKTRDVFAILWSNSEFAWFPPRDDAPVIALTETPDA
jgi:hypothetical protein